MRYVIIGAGAAGMTAARTIRECEPNGEIVVISEDEHVHSRCMLHKYLSHERDEDTLNFMPADFFDSQDITWVKGCSVEKIVPESKTLYLNNGGQVSYDRLLIATGAKSFIPPVGDFRNATNVFGLRDLKDAQDIDNCARGAKEILIVGSGLVGMDAAYAFLEQGIKVNVVEMADRILPLQLDETAGKAYRELFESAGCRFILGRRASETKMDENCRITSVLLDDGTEICCDLVIVAAGVRAAVRFLTDSGIQVERAVTVDGCLKTSCSDIYAAGDVAGLSGIWPNAMKQGQTAAYNMCGKTTYYVDRYAMKNTMNFFGLVTLSIGNGIAEDGDEILVSEDSKGYKKAIVRDGRLKSILLQGNIDYSGIYQYLIKNEVLLPEGKDVFQLDFADFYGVMEDGQYIYAS
ncbi:FAD-dependent oxidoreductase [Ruminococcus sp. OA3]|uniref:NAD(P)/FAD-dependent oxidoreductase n=1 Tax=Ruminococcus sp. OA3 TaxID=2914164 RepID=UPI001F06674B|nr:FAD-dependent oxidoreductase [Ruminococcus sp. OA3]MCH1982612.1 FAD-dependent oxidoreductase [Ruminococcus sp. OA3]